MVFGGRGARPRICGQWGGVTGRGNLAIMYGLALYGFRPLICASIFASGKGIAFDFGFGNGRMVNSGYLLATAAGAGDAGGLWATVRGAATGRGATGGLALGAGTSMATADTFWPFAE